MSFFKWDYRSIISEDEGKKGNSVKLLPNFIDIDLKFNILTVNISPKNVSDIGDYNFIVYGKSGKILKEIPIQIKGMDK